jgi:hypothetical protein
MAYFEDLTPYIYLHPEEELPCTVNIGWLEPGYPFPTGTTSEQFQIKLNRLCHRRVKQTRGFHPCEFCPCVMSSLECLASSFEMRVSGDGVVYAAPSLVHHYVVAHGYRPPDAFTEAVLAWDETAPRFGQDELWARLSSLHDREISSLNLRSAYRIASVDETAKRCEIEYTSGFKFVLSSEELNALNRELYGRGSLTSDYMNDNARRVLGWRSWNPRGSAMFAILQMIDDGIRDVDGSLSLWWPLVGESDIRDARIRMIETRRPWS